DAQRRGGLSTGERAHGAAKVAVEPGDESPLPLAEVVVDRRPRGELTREVSPLAARLSEVEEGVEDVAAQVILPFALPVEEGFDSFPLGVRQVGAVASSGARRVLLGHGVGRSCVSGISQDADGLSLVLRGDAPFLNSLLET